jgi:hypothetical protein
MGSRLARGAAAVLLLCAIGCGGTPPESGSAAPPVASGTPSPPETIRLYSYGTLIATYTARPESVYSRDSWIVFTTTDGRAITWTGSYLIESAPR